MHFRSKRQLTPCDVSGGTQSPANMATQESTRTKSSSSEDFSASEPSSSDYNLNESGSEEDSMNEEEAGPRPYRFEPERQTREEDNTEEVEEESETDRLGNTDWLVFIPFSSRVKHAVRIKKR